MLPDVFQEDNFTFWRNIYFRKVVVMFKDPVPPPLMFGFEIII